MKRQLRLNDVYVKKSKLHGYGVFAAKRLRKGEVIEECYLLITRGKDIALEDYYFDANGKYALLTGFGIIYNHSDEPNADYNINVKNKVAVFKADRDIMKGEEIFVSYGDKWFKSRGVEAKAAKEKVKKTKKKMKLK